MKPTDKELAALNAEMHKLCGWHYDASRHAWHRNGYWTAEPDTYTTDPAAAMQVLEKLAQKRNEAYDPYCPDATLVIHAPHKDWKNKWIVASDPTHRIIAEADTLPLALCLFAKALFSK